jgi:hypothetical protein
MPMNAHLRKIHHKPFDAMFPANLRMSAFRVCGKSLLQCIYFYRDAALNTVIGRYQTKHCPTDGGCVPKQ